MDVSKNAKDVWISLFDKSLDNFMVQNDLIRDLSMIIHILQLKFEAVKNYILENEKRRQDYENQNKRFDESKNVLSADITSNNMTTILLEKTGMQNISTSDTTNVLPDIAKQNISKIISSPTINNSSVDLLELDDDLFNQQISELDMDELHKSNNSDNIIDDSFSSNSFTELQPNTESSTSPKLNKKKRLNRSLRLNIKKSLMPEETIYPSEIPKNELTDDVICNTPEISDEFVNRRRKKQLKQSKLFSSFKNSEEILRNKSQSDENIRNSQEKTMNQTENISASNTTTTVDKTAKVKLWLYSNKLWDKKMRAEKRSFDDDETFFEPEPSTSKLNCTVTNVDNDFRIPRQLSPKKIKKSYKENVLECSYDRVPIREDNDPKYAFKEVVRKKSEKDQLPGWDCQDCEKYYTKIKGLSDKELRERMNACSRHKAKHNPFAVLTPPGFWDPDFTPTQDYKELKF